MSEVETGIWLPDSFIVFKGISRLSEKILARVYGFQKSGKECYAGNEFFAEKHSVSTRAVKNAFKQLREMGLIQTVDIKDENTGRQAGRKTELTKKFYQQLRKYKPKKDRGNKTSLGQGKAHLNDSGPGEQNFTRNDNRGNKTSKTGGTKLPKPGEQNFQNRGNKTSPYNKEDIIKNYSKEREKNTREEEIEIEFLDEEENVFESQELNTNEKNPPSSAAPPLDGEWKEDADSQAIIDKLSQVPQHLVIKAQSDKRYSQVLLHKDFDLQEAIREYAPWQVDKWREKLPDERVFTNSRKSAVFLWRGFLRSWTPKWLEINEKRKNQSNGKSSNTGASALETAREMYNYYDESFKRDYGT